jgi:hypothetical protein
MFFCRHLPSKTNPSKISETFRNFIVPNPNP